MTRADLLAYLKSTFEEITGELNITTGDTAESYKYPLDMTFNRLGMSESAWSTATTNEVESAMALAEYYSLRRFLTKVANRQDYADGVGAKSLSRTQLFRQLQDLLKEASERAATLGYSVTGGTAFASDVMRLDYLEPVSG